MTLEEMEKQVGILEMQETAVWSEVQRYKHIRRKILAKRRRILKDIEVLNGGKKPSYFSKNSTMEDIDWSNS